MTLVVSLLTFSWVSVGLAANGTLVLVSRASGPVGASGNDWSYQPSISADGRFVAFMSEASNLHPGDRNHAPSVFVRDLQTNTTTLVSRASGSGGRNANGDSYSPSISADGRFVAFASEASNLDPDAADRRGKVFVRDLEANTTTLVSRASGPDGASGDDLSFLPSMSADGRTVAFVSLATNLHPDASGSTTGSVFVRDLRDDRTTLVGRASGPAEAIDLGNDDFLPSMSGDGRRVAFVSIPSEDLPGRFVRVFVRDLEANRTTLVSRASGPDGAAGNESSFLPSISDDGRFVAFMSFASNLGPGARTGGVFVRDLQASATALVSRASGPAGARANGQSFAPSISANGRLVAFGSYASNLHPNDPGQGGDVFVRDVQANTTALITRGVSPRSGDDPAFPAYRQSMSADGRVVAFSSDASNLHPDDRDTDGDIFARQLGSPPLPGPPRILCHGRRAPIVLLRRSGPVAGTDGADVIVGSSGADTIRGGKGNDLICGHGGRDRLLGSEGRDYLLGGAGSDRIGGGRHADLLAGGPGDDLLDGGAGRDRILGGSGNDLLPTAGVFADRVDCGPGRDVVIADRLDTLHRCEHHRVREQRRR